MIINYKIKFSATFAGNDLKRCGAQTGVNVTFVITGSILNSVIGLNITELVPGK